MARVGRPWREIKQELLQNADFRQAYEELEPEFQVARSLIALRATKRITQAAMAKKAAIHRPMLSRLESARGVVTIPTLARLAAALDAKIELRFVDKNNKNIKAVPPIRVGRSTFAMRERHR